MNLEKKLNDFKISSPNPPPNLCDLPVEIVEMIVKNLNLTRREIVGKVCKTLLEIVNGLKPPRCDDIKITFGPEGCEMKIDRYTIKYGKADEESLNEMLDDLMTLLPDFQLTNFTIRINDTQSYKLFRTLFSKRVPESLKVDTYVLKAFSFRDTAINVTWHYKRDLLSVLEYHEMERLKDDIIKVKVCRTRPPGIVDNVLRARTIEKFMKYFREGQEDIYVDDPDQLPPKEQ
uniref:F-box domain-containing protein n=1 Tax=Caenorhabditis tropicalis TaxID=1561998 RepID=A0A1I7T0W7_9PELO